jgi:uncharacterized membrane protein
LARGGELAARQDEQSTEITPEQLPLPGFDVIRWSSHIGPLPPAAQLAEYDALVPGLARELADAALADMAADRKINELEVETASKLDLRGQAYAILLTSVCVALAAVCLFVLDPPWLALSGAGVFGLGAVAPVINAFLHRGRMGHPGENPPQD